MSEPNHELHRYTNLVEIDTVDDDLGQKNTIRKRTERLIKAWKIWENMKIRKICASIGVTMLLMMSCMGESHPLALLVWLAVSVAMIYIGRAFDFQNKNSKDVQGR